MGLGYGEVLGDTLAMVNVVRQAMGYEPLTELPDAKTGDPADCLYYRALADCGVTNVGVGEMQFRNERQAALVAELWGTTHDGATVSSPGSIRRVISDFDGDQLPHYNE